jgi:probable DNA repair protein
MLLNPVQETAVWEALIRESREGHGLLRLPETAALAKDAWELIHAHRLPFKASTFGVSEDCEAFFAWAAEFERQRDANRWIEAARVSDRVVGSFRDGVLTPPSEVVLAGFDEFTPQQQDLLATFPNWREVKSPSDAGAVECQGRCDAADEIRSAAVWARAALERDGSARVGVLVPNLAGSRGKIERALREVLRGEDSFHISLGRPLRDHPLIHAAFLLLELASPADALTAQRWSMLLRSPFLGGAETERSARALLDAELRRRGGWNLTRRWVREMAAACPVLQKTLAAIEKEAGKPLGEQAASQWSRWFSRLLRVAGWPGERSLSSGEYQGTQAWSGLLSNFATLDAVAGGMELGRALSSLEQLARNTLFQAEDKGAPVQVMGLLEASGLQFDQLWVMGLHADALPARAAPNPFLPIGLQRDHRLPHSSPSRELEYAQRLLHRLLSSAGEIVLTFPRQEGDQVLDPSPLLPSPPKLELPAVAFESWNDRIRRSAAVEWFVDGEAPPLAAAAIQGSGTSLFKDMAACPFRAFAIHRLKARPLESVEFGLTARDRGLTVHKALELIWAELKSHAALVRSTEEQLQDVVRRSIAAALGDSKRMGRTVEQRCLEEIVTKWLKCERTRPPFVVLESERKRPVTIGGIEVNTRIDRVDQLADGRLVILDYKTGNKLAGDAWCGDRLGEPQVPLYCVTSSQTVAAAAFVWLHKPKAKFKGLGGEELGPMDKMLGHKNKPFSRVVEEWRSALERLGQDFRAGMAAVDPKDGACDFCQVTAFCRTLEAAEEPQVAAAGGTRADD